MQIPTVSEITGDCVIRAISFILDLDYYKVLDILLNNSEYFNCDMLLRDCYAQTLSEGFGLPCYDGMGKTVRELADDLPYSKIIARVPSHLTAIKDSNIYDTWDTSDEIVDMFWVVI